MATFTPPRKFGPKAFSLAQLDWSVDFLDPKEPKLEYFRNPRVLPAVMALLNTITLVRNEAGLISTDATLEALKERISLGTFTFTDGTTIDNNTMGRIFLFLRVNSRSSILSGTQSLPANIRYSGNVPLFMSAFKQYRDVDYSEWDLTDPKLKYVIDPLNLELLEFSCTEFEFGWSSEELISLGTKMYTDVGGRTPGKVNPIGLYKYKKTGDEDFDTLPRYVRMMLCQVWLFQPVHDTKFAIRNLHDIDASAEHLIDTELFKPVVKKEKIKLIEETLW